MMSDSKEYVSRSDELGGIHISEEVLATIPEDYTNILARVAALESCGFVVVNGKVCMKYVKT